MQVKAWYLVLFLEECEEGEIPKRFICFGAWAEFGIKLYPGSGQRCWDRMEGDFPVDFPILMPLDRTIHHRWKNSKKGGLYSKFNARKSEGKTTGGFINDTYNTWEDIPQETFQNSIEGCQKIYKSCYNNRGNITM